jgi:hypothetical protein
MLNLEQRVRLIEDRLEIMQLIASHPPAIDTGDGKAYGRLFTGSGVFDYGPGESIIPLTAMADGLGSQAHGQAVAGGMAHFGSLPHIVLEGDRAVATTYLQLLIPASGPAASYPNHGQSAGYAIFRITINRWDVVREAGGWRIQRRTARVVETPEARAILAQAAGASSVDVNPIGPGKCL